MMAFALAFLLTQDDAIASIKKKIEGKLETCMACTGTGKVKVEVKGATETECPFCKDGKPIRSAAILSVDELAKIVNSDGIHTHPVSAMKHLVYAVGAVDRVEVAGGKATVILSGTSATVTRCDLYVQSKTAGDLKKGDTVVVMSWRLNAADSRKAGAAVLSNSRIVLIEKAK